MYLSDSIDFFMRNHSADVLKQIIKEHGKQGFSIACKRAGLKRGDGKRILGIYNDDGPISQVASVYGFTTSKAFRR